MPLRGTRVEPKETLSICTSSTKTRDYISTGIHTICISTHSTDKGELRVRRKDEPGGPYEEAEEEGRDKI